MMYIWNCNAEFWNSASRGLSPDRTQKTTKLLYPVRGQTTGLSIFLLNNNTKSICKRLNII
jgi:hypothetical protein